MDKVNFNPFSEILVEDFLRQSGYIGDAFKLFIADFLCQNTTVLGLEVTAQAVPNMTVYVKPGRIYQAGLQGQLMINLDPALAITAAHPTYARIDRICAQYRELPDTPETRNVMIDTVSRQVTQKTVMTRVAGTIDFMVVPGVAAPGPASPTVPDGWTSLAQVNVRANTTAVLQTDIVDERPKLKSLATHGHSGGIDGAKIDYSSLLNRPTPYNSYWKAGTAYSVGDICYSSTGASYKYFECTVAGTSGATEPTWPAVDSTVTDGSVTWKVRDIKNGSGEQVGSVKAWLANAAPAGWLACDTGALVSRATYPQLWEWVQTNAPLITEAAWQAQAAVQSSVGYYSSGDGSTTFRLPRLVDYVRGGLMADVGTWQGDAIRNITGKFEGGNSGYSGAFTKGITHKSNTQRTSSETDLAEFTFNASAVVPTADENRPKTILFLFCVKAFDAPTNQGMIDITELANDVTDKVSYTDFMGVNQSLSANGWQQLPGGLILQWGTTASVTSIAADNSATQAVIFPIAFNAACIGGWANVLGGNGSVFAEVNSETLSSGTVAFRNASPGVIATNLYAKYYVIGY